MKKLSINIPTYNRAEFLVKNLSIIADQLNQDRLVDQVEINISDNASTDNTESVVKDFASQNPNLDLTYHRNEKNLGPDLNFIAAMNMAHGEYSILFGDDDYFEDGAILAYLRLFESNPDITIFLSNRISINANGKITGKNKFLREGVGSEVFDFKSKNDARAYFSIVADHGGILTFISSVIYKTSILGEIGKYNEKCTGTCYSFLYYWWGAIIKGKKLMYIDEYYVRATVKGATNNNYGQGIMRLLVDTEGLSKISEIVFADNNQLKNNFLAAVRTPISTMRIYTAIMNDTTNNTDRLYKSMVDCGWSMSDIRGWQYMLNKRNSIKYFIKNITPVFISNKIHF